MSGLSLSRLASQAFWYASSTSSASRATTSHVHSFHEHHVQIVRGTPLLPPLNPRPVRPVQLSLFVVLRPIQSQRAGQLAPHPRRCLLCSAKHPAHRLSDWHITASQARNLKQGGCSSLTTPSYPCNTHAPKQPTPRPPSANGPATPHLVVS